MKKFLTVLLSLILGASMLAFAACADPSGEGATQTIDAYLSENGLTG